MAIKQQLFSFNYNSKLVRIEYFIRRAYDSSKALVYLPGLGCKKEDALKMCSVPALKDYSIISINHPGVGLSTYDESINSTRNFVNQINFLLERLSIKKTIVAGHSYGGIHALLLYELFPEKVAGFINIEGNLAPEDCIFTREIIQSNFEEFENTFYQSLLKKLRNTNNKGMKKYFEALTELSSLKAYYNYSKEIVDYSDNSSLLEKFLKMESPKIFIYGSENEGLSYLPKLRNACEVSVISSANHFPFYDNPQEFSDVINNFITKNFGE